MMKEVERLREEKNRQGSVEGQDVSTSQDFQIKL
jgi:hypothetical protein